MTKGWKAWLSWLISPMAIGFYITLITVKLTMDFYVISARPNRHNDQSLSSILYMIHQKSIDYRLRVRGPRKVSPDLAMLAIDGRSVDTLGRWPWPRAVIAKGIENAFHYGAKVLAFDMVFSEPSLNPATVLYDKIQSSGAMTPPIQQALTKFEGQLDNDKDLSDVFSEYGEHIVAGSFYVDAFHPDWPPETEFCHDMVYHRTAASKQWDNEEVLTSPTDPYQPYVPTALTGFMKAILDQEAQTIRAHAKPPQSPEEVLELNQKVHEKLDDSCNTIFDDYGKYFSQVWTKAVLPQEDAKEFKFPTFESWLRHFRQNSLKNAVLDVENWRLDTPEIARGTKHTGYFSTYLDPDGTIRREPLIVRTANSYFPALALKAFMVANNLNAAPKLDQDSTDPSRKRIVDFQLLSNDTGNSAMSVPTDDQGNMLINYAGPDHMFPYLSFADLVSDSPDATISQRVWNPQRQDWEVKQRKVKKADFIKNKIFIVGATATGIFDLRLTPFAKDYPGAETHLNVIDNLTQNQFLRTLPDEPVYMPMILAGIGLVMSVALSYLGAIWGLALTALALVGVTFYDQHFLFDRGIVVAVIWPLFLIMFLYVSLTFYRYLTEERNKKELRQTFQKYVSPAIVEEILANPENIELGGKKVTLTVFFSDIRGFTTISEKLDPKALSDLLNSYLTPMTDLVFRNRGTLDKYMGDAIMAFFGAPITYPDHAKYACRCALQNLQKLEELKAEYERKGLPTIDIGIGLNTGEVSVGNMGSETVRNYTVMGDAVNLASRLEGINKQYGTRIILSEMTYADVKDSFICREIDWVRVKGKILPVKIYELIAEEKTPAAWAEVLKYFQEGYQQYHAKAWQKGLECFSKAVDLNSLDSVSQLYVQRCQNYIVQPPEDGWDGVFVMKTK